MRETVMWVTGLMLMVAAAAYTIGGPVALIAAVGAVLFVAGVAIDYWEL